MTTLETPRETVTERERRFVRYVMERAMMGYAVPKAHADAAANIMAAPARRGEDV